jgi:hypothetical protein
MGSLIYGTEFVPSSALFIPGFGAGKDHPLAKAFLEYAELAGIDGHVAPLIDVEGDYSVVPSVKEQADRAREHLASSDLIIAWSAGAVIASKAFEGVEADLDQRLVLLNPSVRRPDGFIKKYGRSGDKLTELETELAPGYGDIDYVLPGQNPGDRLIAVSGHYMNEVLPADYEPRDFVAVLISKFSAIGLPRARVLKVARDTRLGPDHPKLMDDMRQRLDSLAIAGINTREVGDHYFTGQEYPVMENILSGKFFSSEVQELWARDRVTLAS